jgi:hypothetical protein
MSLVATGAYEEKLDDAEIEELNEPRLGTGLSDIGG